MYEFHGWAGVRYDTHDFDPREQDACWERVLAHARRIDAPANLIRAVRDNGVDTIAVDGQHNHRGADWPLALFRFLAEAAPGSYGVLFVHDDEDPRGDRYRDGFCVWRLCRGRVDEHVDTLLSPVVPMIEEPYDPSRDGG